MPTEYRVYSNDGAGGAVDYSTPVGTVSGPGGTWDAPALGPDEDWTYAVRAYDSDLDLEEQNTDVRVRILTDGSGLDISDRPPACTLVSARPGGPGEVVVSWSYLARPGWRPPYGFRIWAQVGPIDYGLAPDADVTYMKGVPGYVHRLTGLTGGATIDVAVRAYNSVADDGSPETIEVAVPSASVATAVAGAAGQAAWGD